MSGVMAIGLGIERDLEMAKNRGDGSTVCEKAGLRLFLGLGDIAADKIR